MEGAVLLVLRRLEPEHQGDQALIDFDFVLQKCDFGVFLRELTTKQLKDGTRGLVRLTRACEISRGFLYLS
jgi:hypothetical protein